MEIRLKMLAVCLLIAQLLYSKDTYPKRVVINKDTIVAFTDSQATQILQTYIALEGCQSESFLKDTIINTQDGLIVNYEKTISYYEKKDSLNKLIIEDQDTKYNETSSTLNTIIKNQKKKQFQSNLAFGLTTPVFVAIGIIVGFLIHK